MLTYKVKRHLGRLIAYIGLAFLFFTLSAGTACADAYDDGVAAYKHGEYLQALKIWQPLAIDGNGDAQQAVGLLFDLGYGVRQSFPDATDWYRRSAEGGNKIGQFRLGFMYENGLGVAKDAAQAAAWYRKAADQHVIAAEARLSSMYEIGIGVNIDTDQAALWLNRATEDTSRYGLDSKCVSHDADDVTVRNALPEGCHGEAIEGFGRNMKKEPSPLSGWQLTEVVLLIETRQSIPFFEYHRYYAATMVSRPDIKEIASSYYLYDYLMEVHGAARPFLRAVYREEWPHEGWAISLSSGSVQDWSIVAEDALPIMIDGGCGLVSALYDVSGREVMSPECNGPL